MYKNWHSSCSISLFLSFFLSFSSTPADFFVHSLTHTNKVSPRHSPISLSFSLFPHELSLLLSPSRPLFLLYTLTNHSLAPPIIRSLSLSPSVAFSFFQSLSQIYSYSHLLSISLSITFTPSFTPPSFSFPTTLMFHLLSLTTSLSLSLSFSPPITHSVPLTFPLTFPLTQSLTLTT